jgi:phospholipase D1/2
MPLADPPKPPMDDSVAPPRGWPGRIVWLGGALVVILLLAAAWKLTPLGTVANRHALAAFLAGWQGWSVAPLVIAMFVVGSLIAFPVVLLMLATAAAVEPAIGLPSALCGILISAALLFAIGRHFGEQAVRNIAGSRFRRVRDMLLGNGVLAIALVRMIPVLPFSLVSLAAGALRIRFADFLLGTMFGLAPGLIGIFALGATLSKLIQDPSAANMVPVIFAAAVWLMLVVFSQYAIRRMSR